MSATDRRRQTIEELLAEQGAGSQAELLELLAARGIAATQPQLSRDLRALGVVKRDGRYYPGERVTGLAALAMLLRDALPAGPHLVVIECEAGSASAVARALEAEDPPGLVGTIAGDDTVFVAVQSKKAGEAVRDLVLALV
jgi:transcriptional regulator of arginine metabolism